MVRLGDSQAAVECRLGAPDRVDELGAHGAMADWDALGLSVLVRDEEVGASYLSGVQGSQVPAGDTDPYTGSVQGEGITWRLEGEEVVGVVVW